MSDKVAELKRIFEKDDPADWIVNQWTSFYYQSFEKRAEWLELKKYIFATDTSTTSNNTLPWTNKTTLPKICQIRDNLHANYMSALFPNDKWLKWEAHSKDAAKREVARNITAYMDNKARESGFMTTMSRLLYDYIDYGNAFAMPTFESRYLEQDGQRVKDYVGPKLVRVNPEHIVFNPLADSFDQSFKVVRSIRTVGELKRMAQLQPDQAFWEKAVERRHGIRNMISGYSVEDFNRAELYEVDGFGSLNEYYQSDYVEIMEFYGDYHDHQTGELRTNRMITIVDRAMMVRDVEIPTYAGRAPIFHVGWRFRPDNLWAMGPLDNLVGLQYRIDHLENLKADAMDLIVHPPLKIIGEVEEFSWAPRSEIFIDSDNSDVQEVSKNLNGIITANNDIQLLEDKMELYAGAPREAAGIRTPGEKTAFEVQQLQNAAGRIFQEKITKFEIELLEPVLNSMLETAHRHLDQSDTIRVLDTDIGVTQFQTITKDDITADGILRPIGARHFAERAQELQNLIGIFSSPLAQILAPHTSSKALTEYVNDTLRLKGYDLFRPNVAIMEQQETQGLAQQAQEDTMVAADTPTEGTL